MKFTDYIIADNWKTRENVMAKNGYYTSGEFARKANVTLRTIRYYDKQGILKPSKIGENGYRYYTDGDFAKLQKILSLKYLGFSLEEIMTITINDQDKDFVRQSLRLQLGLVRKKIEHLNIIEQSLKDTAEKMEHNHEVDWEEIVQLLHVTNREHVLVDQYKNASNLDVRIQLHKDYSVNEIRWFPWIYQQLDIKSGMKVLELGCGTGGLWTENMEKLPEQVDIYLSDQSAGMAEDARNNIRQAQKELRQKTAKSVGNPIEQAEKAENNKTQFHFKVFDCEKIPYKDKSFDLVVANHVLFYIEDRQKVYEEINRVLKPGGIFVCSTYGKGHMKEITQLVQDFDADIVLSEKNLYDVFGLENGKEELETFFSKVEQRLYEDYLLVDKAEPIVDYILSCHGNQHEHLSRRYLEFKDYVRQKLKKEPFRITKMAGIFVCQRL